MTQRTDIPIPKRMAHLDRDPRGYPIPVIVFRDKTGRPHFTINDEAKRLIVLMEERCSICGTKLLRERWFVGGPLSAFHPRGHYIDPPLHRDCMRYALRVCPYLAVPNYGKRIDARTVEDDKIEQTRIFVDPTLIPERPAIFVCVGAVGQDVTFRGSGPLGPTYVKPCRPYSRVEFWKDGSQISRAAAITIIKKIGVDSTNGKKTVDETVQ